MCVFVFSMLPIVVECHPLCCCSFLVVHPFRSVVKLVSRYWRSHDVSSFLSISFGLLLCSNKAGLNFLLFFCFNFIFSNVSEDWKILPLVTFKILLEGKWLIIICEVHLIQILVSILSIKKNIYIMKKKKSSFQSKIKLPDDRLYSFKHLTFPRGRLSSPDWCNKYCWLYFLEVTWEKRKQNLPTNWNLDTLLLLRCHYIHIVYLDSW